MTRLSLVIDSNVWISALVFGGEPRRVFEAVVQNGDRIVLSEEMLSEIRRSLTRKFPDFVYDFEALLAAFQPLIHMVPLGSVTVDASRDADDNRVIETAMIGRADTIVTGDNDLLSLREYAGISMMKPVAWLDRQRTSLQ